MLLATEVCKSIRLLILMAGS